MTSTSITVTFIPSEYRLVYHLLDGLRQQQEDYLTGKGDYQGEGLRERTERDDPTLDVHVENLEREEQKLAQLNNLLDRL